MIWDDARIFLAIARSGTLSGAAHTLDMGVATVSRRLERLEAGLGMPLFSRHQQGYRLTSGGDALLGQAEALENAARAFEESALEQHAVAGCVRLATTDNIANEFIAPSLPTLFAEHPALHIELVSSVDTLNIHRRDADIAVRMVKPEAGNITMRRLATVGFGLYGAPDYVAAHAHDAWTACDFIGWSEDYAHLPAAQWIAAERQGRPCRLQTTTLMAQVVAARAGAGLAVLPHFLARSAALSCVSSTLDLDQSLWLAMQTELAHTRRVRAVADHLIALFENCADVLSGSVDLAS
ncbi:LysR family transcriptional regulator [Zymobacter palmae]|uniref:Transcriptional regulator n=1 Tax=Zymobacter palmae TaxID=33074 RepID=A0A348HB45_9GAMM|nr:LysR family transcriptional regulator [Zymobacter palmae]BBG28847.1 transcriptional regulator [Zymobacter palmae]